MPYKQAPQKLRVFLVKKLNVSFKEALKLFQNNKILLNGKKANPIDVVTRFDEVKVSGEIIQPGKKFIYIKFNKPRGIESTLNKTIPDNLTTVFNYPEKLFPVGRLDKESEGLMIFTNDGEYYKRITDKNNDIEKEYVVTVNKPISTEFIQQMENGVKIMGKMTKKAILKPFTEISFNIILTEGMNRQIRRMCYKLGYEVGSLKRIRIDDVLLGDLKTGECSKIK